MNSADDVQQSRAPVPFLLLPPAVLASLTQTASQRSLTLPELLAEQGLRLLHDDSFAEEAARLADALWRRLDSGPAAPFAWPVDPLVCAGGALVFAADLQHEADEGLLRMGPETLERFDQESVEHGLSYEELIAEALHAAWGGAEAAVPAGGPDPAQLTLGQPKG